MKPLTLPALLLLFLSILCADGRAQNKNLTKSKLGKPIAQAAAPSQPGGSAQKPASATKKPKNSTIEIKTLVSIPGAMAVPAKSEEAAKPEAQPQLSRRNMVEMSFQLLTTASWNSASGWGAAALTDDFGGGLRTTVGPNIDCYFFRDRYAFGTGLWYTIRRMGYSQRADRSPTASIQTAAFNLQCLQVPLTMKLVSNTLFRTGRSFIQYGGTIDFKLAETAIDYPNNYLRQRDGNIDQFTAAGLSLLLAAGYMHRMGPTNDLMITMQYQRSLTNNAIPTNLWAISQHLGFGIGLTF